MQGVEQAQAQARYRAPHWRKGAKWLACWTQDEIGESEGMTDRAIGMISEEFPNLEKLQKSSQTLATYADCAPHRRKGELHRPPGCTPVSLL